MYLTDADIELLTGLVSSHIIDLHGQLKRRTDLTDAGRESYARQMAEAYEALRTLARCRARQELAA